MKKAALILPIIALILSSCVTVINTPGPDGRPGRAYFGIDYDYKAPYSYWDNNPSVPNDPFFAEYYPTHTGIFDFEYFYNKYDYWYGTYEIWVNAGGRGGAYGEPGFDGADTYMMLICNPDGPYEFRKANGEALEITELADGFIEYTITFDGGGMKVKMKKVSTTERDPEGKEPKLVQ